MDLDKLILAQQSALGALSVERDEAADQLASLDARIASLRASLRHNRNLARAALAAAPAADPKSE